jgi:hypothetical protein
MKQFLEKQPGLVPKIRQLAREEAAELFSDDPTND